MVLRTPTVDRLVMEEFLTNRELVMAVEPFAGDTPEPKWPENSRFWNQSQTRRRLNQWSSIHRGRVKLGNVGWRVPRPGLGGRWMKPPSSGYLAGLGRPGRQVSGRQLGR